MQFLTNPISPNCRKVDAVAKQLGLPLEHRIIDVAKREHRTPEFLALNPNGKVPVLVADFCLASSLTFAERARLPLAGFDNLQRWLLALDEQPGWRGSRPPPM